MSGTYSAYQTDEKAERDGVVFDMGKRGKFILARAGGANERYKECIRRVTKPHRRQIAAGTIDPEVADRLVIQAFASTVILGWENVTGPDGADFPFSTENAIKLLTDLPDLFAELRDLAEDMNNYRREVLEAEGKPSAPISSTT